MKKNDEEFCQIFAVSFLKKLQIMGYDFMFFHTPNSGHRSKSEASKFKLMGVLPGVPDLQFITPKGVFFIELKKDTGRLSTSQKEFADIVNRYKINVHQVFFQTPQECIEKISEVLREYVDIQKSDISSASAKALTGFGVKS